MRRAKFVTWACLATTAGLAFAAGGGGGGGGKNGGRNPQPAGIAEVRSLNESIPAGGTVQAKFSLTTPRPISGGGPKFQDYGFEINGIGIVSPLGTTVGVALSNNGVLSVEIISPDSDYGTNTDYPFLTIAMTVPDGSKPGQTFPLQMADTVVNTPSGPVTLSNTKVGTLTVGGSVSIHGLVPGGGTWPAGTMVRVQGTGFGPGTKFATKMKTSSAVYVSPTEAVFFLQTATTLDGQSVTMTNPDGSSATYYSYLRGVPVSQPTRSLLRKADPIFQTQTHTSAVLGPIAPAAPGEFTGLALQNPGLVPALVWLTHDRTGASKLVMLPSGGRLMDEIGAILGVDMQAGDVVRVTSATGVQILGLSGDDNTVTLRPFLPAF
jgi:hypothetical protein